MLKFADMPHHWFFGLEKLTCSDPYHRKRCGNGTNTPTEESPEKKEPLEASKHSIESGKDRYLL